MDTCHRELPWKCGKPPSYPRSRELPMSSCNHSLGGKYPVVPCRNNLDRQETHGIRMVMNGETVEHQVHTWTGNGYIVKRSMLPVTDEIRARLLGPDVNGEHFMEITTMGTTVVVKATEESIRVLRATAKASAQDLGILPESDNASIMDRLEADEAMVLNEVEKHMDAIGFTKCAQNTDILPESECPPPLPTSGEVAPTDRKPPGDATQASVKPVFHP
jgi:hypothetical protein